MSADQDWLKVVALPAMIASIPGGIGLWQWWIARNDKRAADARTATQTATEKREASLNAERDALTKDMRDLLQGVENARDWNMAEVDRLRKELTTVSRDRDRGWALARHYYRLAGSLLHALKNVRTMVGGIVGRMTPPEQVPEWEAFDVPVDMEAPIPREKA